MCFSGELYLGGEETTEVAGREQSLTTLNFPRLASVGDELNLEYMGPITKVVFPALASITGVTDLDYNAGLVEIAFPKLAQAGTIKVRAPPPRPAWLRVVPPKKRKQPFQACQS